VRVENATLLDNLNMPTRGGLYDPRLGPMKKGDICETCKMSYFACQGHFGHIELPSPVYHPLFMNKCYQLLRSVCLYCHHFKMPEIILKRFAARLRLLDAGCLEEAHYVAHLAPTGSASKRTEEGDAVEEDDDADVSAESAAEFILRMDTYVKQVLKHKKKQNVRDAYKDVLVYKERQDVIKEFSKKIWNRCSHCQAYGNTFRKEKSIKIVEYDLTPKQKQANQVLNLKKPSAGFGANGRSLVTKKKKGDAMDVDEGIEASSASGSSGSEDEMEVDEDEQSDESEDQVDEGLGDDGVARTASGQIKGSRGRNERVMAVAEVRGHLRRAFQLEAEMCTLLYGHHGNVSARVHARPAPVADMFFMDVVLVTPTCFRPASMMGDDLFENAQNTLLTALINTCDRVTQINQTMRDFERLDKSPELAEKLKAFDRTRSFEMLLNSLVQLQHDVNSFIDSTKNPTVMKQGKLPPPGIKQLLEKKEGLFRKHMMGKRVNYAARSVISPDINIETNEIGIPPVFAKKLTYPEPVTPQNVHEMRRLVINGPKVHPGATLVQNEDGSQVSLDRMSPEQREAVANQLLTPQNDQFAGGSSTAIPARNKKVFRHIRDGDIVILNRQPTLHKPSMMCHKVKVLRGEKTIRMHYANCNSYNADFDGDEMNIHFPQNEIARAEAQMLANTDNQYLVPTSGNPLRGLIQDHIVAGVWMCNKSTFFTREEYYQLIYGALRTENNYTGGGRIRTVPPAIFKPRPMWTGKQIFSTILLNLTPANAKGLNLMSKNKITNSLWQRDDSKDKDMSEEQVIFVDGHLLVGVLDKSQYGASSYGLVHSVHELYGPYVANRLLAVLSRVLTKYLQNTAFTCRMDDLILTEEGEKLRKDILDAAKEDGVYTAMKYVGLPEGSKADDPSAQANLKMRLEEILHDDSLMAGYDGVMQQKFNKTTSKINNDVLPAHLIRPFPDNNMQTMTISGAKGSKVNASQISTLLGQQALEGRRVPTMVSGKTLPAFKAYDTSARAGGYVANRFLTGVRPQEYYFHCMAGREGLIDTAVKTARSGYLQRCLIKHLEGVKVHYDHTVRDSDASILQFQYGDDAIDVTKSKHLTKFDFAARNHDSMLNKYDPSALVGKVDDSEAIDWSKKALRKPAKYEPAMSIFSPSRYLGAMSEAYMRDVNEYIASNKAGYIQPRKGDKPPSAYASQRIPEREFAQLARVRYMRSLVEPGEAVGLLASQGVGEPSTQMTLNTFHLAGHGAANVTLGIPRLREIVMTAAKEPATPTMTLPLREHVEGNDADAFVKHVSRLTLSEVVEQVTVTERLSGKTAEANNSRVRKYTVLLDFYPPEEYTDEYKITVDQLHESLCTSFADRIKRQVVNQLRTAVKAKEQDEAVGKGLRLRAGADMEEAPRRGRDDELDDDDEDAGQLKRARQTRALEYEDDEAETGVQDLEDIIEAGQDSDEEKDEDEDAAAKAAWDEASDALAEQFKRASKYATDFHFDAAGKSAQFELQFPGQAPKLLLVDLVEQACRDAVIHEIPRLGRCLKNYDDKGVFSRSLTTEGSNIKGMWELADELIELDKIGSNDVYAILQTYGVEAARRTIINEMAGIFGVYGIGVDYRHLTVIADYMTHAGGYSPFNRTGIMQKSSPLLKASFETTVAFLSDATLHGDFDDLSSPAARIVLGKPSASGTGAFDVRAPTRM
jgi:DNA-directed RNA polymerase I subunit RPA1